MLKPYWKMQYLGSDCLLERPLKKFIYWKGKRREDVIEKFCCIVLNLFKIGYIKAPTATYSWALLE
jgi:hypothetical protein